MLEYRLSLKVQVQQSIFRQEIPFWDFLNNPFSV
jgi:hypothetical protein